MYNPKSMKADEFISDEEIRETLSTVRTTQKTSIFRAKS